jgi:hypothetical protein
MHGVIFVFLVVLVAVNCQLSTYLSKLDLENIKLKARKALYSSSPLKDVFYASNLLKSLNISTFQCKCDSISKLFSRANNSFEIYYGYNSNELCQCGLDFRKSSSKDLILNSLKVTFYFFLAI